MMEIEDSEDTAYAGAGARVVRELIATPAFQEIIRTGLVSIDPQKAKELVRALLLEDINVSLSFAGKAPDFINYILEILIEIANVIEKMPEPLLVEFFSQAKDRIDREKVESAVRSYSSLAAKFGGEKLPARLFGRILTGLSITIGNYARKNPYFIKDIFENIDIAQILRSSYYVVRSFFLSLFSIIHRALKKLFLLE